MEEIRTCDNCKYGTHPNSALSKRCKLCNRGGKKAFWVERDKDQYDLLSGYYY